MSEFNLSNKAVKDLGCSNPIPDYYWEKDVKEFIELLKNKMNDIPEFGYNYIPRTAVKTMIDKLAGDKLI